MSVVRRDTRRVHKNGGNVGGPGIEHKNEAFLEQNTCRRLKIFDTS